jgi:hypothetical protein
MVISSRSCARCAVQASKRSSRGEVKNLARLDALADRGVGNIAFEEQREPDRADP